MLDIGASVPAVAGRYPSPGNLSVMTYGHGNEPPSGWPPPSDQEPTLYGRRRSADDEDGPDGEWRAFEAPPTPPVAEPPYRPRRSADFDDGQPHQEGGHLTDRCVPRPGGRDSGGRDSGGPDSGG